MQLEQQLSDPVLAPVRAPFRAIAATIVPEAGELTDAEWNEMEALVERALADRPASMRRQRRLLVRLIELLPRARYGRAFTALDAARRTRVLEAMQSAPVLLLRRGIWGLRTLVFLGYYSRPAAAASVGYRADPRGWSARRQDGAS